jgi:hypothetical protein
MYRVPRWVCEAFEQNMYSPTQFFAQVNA